MMRKIDDVINQIYCNNNLDILSQIPDASVDLIVTSPPYDKIRDYDGYGFDFKPTANELKRVLKDGGVIVWIVGDQTESMSETGTSFRQALYFIEIGLLLYDTMIYRKDSAPPKTHRRFEQKFEYMFILSKGSPKTFRPIMEKSKYAKEDKNGGDFRLTDGSWKKRKKASIKKFKIKGNIWNYNVNYGALTKDLFAHAHPALFPDDLARDHIFVWSNEGDIVLDCFNGSGTTTKMAYLMYRNYIGIDCSKEYCEIAEKRLRIHKNNQHHQIYWDRLINPTENARDASLESFV